MLSRTAANLFWIGRYVERLDNQARILEVGYRMSQIPSLDGAQSRDEWNSISVAAACNDQIVKKYGTANVYSCISFIAVDEDNPSSIASCLKAARTNCRAVRTAITGKMWECLNDTWMDFDRQWAYKLTDENLLAFVDWLRAGINQFRGALESTMLREEAYYFLNLGTFIERGDNTARILDMKYHILLPEDKDMGGSVDYYQWVTILRSVSAIGSFHWLYKEPIKHWLVAELLILREEMPRSLRYTTSKVKEYLDAIDKPDVTRHESTRLAGQLLSRLSYDSIDDIFQNGLHEYLADFLQRNNTLGLQIARDFDL